MSNAYDIRLREERRGVYSKLFAVSLMAVNSQTATANRLTARGFGCHQTKIQKEEYGIFMVRLEKK